MQHRSSWRLKVYLHYAVAVACIRFHRLNARPASADGHSLPSTACSWHSAFDSPSEVGKLPFSAFRDIYCQRKELFRGLLKQAQISSEKHH